jgi:signal transduction histidine kinase
MAGRPRRSHIVGLVVATAGPLLLAAVVELYAIPPGTRRSIVAGVVSMIALLVSVSMGWLLVRRLAASCADAERAVDLHKDVLASVAHDLQSPLAAASGYVQLLQTRIAAAPEAPAGSLLSSLLQTQRAMNRIQQMTAELVDAARLDGGFELTLRMQALDLVELIGECVAVEPPAVQKRIRVRCGSSDLWLFGDIDRIGRAISNLISNAAKYSSVASRIEIDLDREENATGDWIVVSVCDHGIGIPADDLPHVFERFHRGSNARQAYIGTGLGLASVRCVVAQHGGRIVIESQQGVGTTAQVYFPAGVSPAAEKKCSLPLAG